MILLDTDILGLFFGGHAKVTPRVIAARDQIATTAVTRIEILRGRFDFLMKAADGEQLERAQRLIEQTEVDLAQLLIIPVTAAAGKEFDDLRARRNLKKIGRADLLIASIALAHKALLVTRNLKHFRQVPHLQLENWAD